MSAINVNSITGRTGSHGPVLTGVTTVSSILHVGGGVTVTGVSTFNNNVTVTGGNVGIGTDNPTYQLQVFNDNIPASLRLQYGSNTGFDVQQMIDGSAQVWNVDNTDLKFATNDQERLRITSAGRVGVNTTTVSAGVNVAVAGTIRVEDTTDATQYLTINHQGIDFQNTGAGSSSTATSHLLDDYEEGTWTPTYVPQNNSFTSITYDPIVRGKYQKIGNTVYVQAFIRTDALTKGTASGFIFVGGLPFLPFSGSGHNHVISLGSVDGWAGDMPDSAMTSSGNIFAFYYRTTANGATSVLEVDDMGGGADDNQVYLSGHYSIN